MIVGEALKRLFSGATVDITTDSVTTTRDIQFGYGDQKELNKWIMLKEKNNLPKYPLIWYVTTDFNDLNDIYDVSSKLVILTNTKPEWLNSTRNVMTYSNIIDPTWQKVKQILIENPYVELIGGLQNRFRIKDVPNYGVEVDNIRLSQNDFASNKKIGTESITIDVVDGRVINLSFRIKPNCII